MDKISIYFSKVYVLILIALAIASLLALSVTGAPFVLKIPLLLALISIFIWELRRARSITAFEKALGSENEWRLYSNNKIWLGSLQGASTITPLFSVLLFKIKGTKKVKSLVLMRDSLSQKSWQLLRRTLFVFVVLDGER